MGKVKKFGDMNSEPPKPSILPPPVPEDITDVGEEELEEDLEESEDLETLELPEPSERMLERAEEPSVTPKPKSSPPLFVKVEKYEDVIRNLQELRSYALSLRDALDALADIEKELKVGMEIAHKALDRLNIIISTLDSKLLRTEGIDIEGELKTPREVEGYIKNVYSQIEKLKSELSAIS